MHTELCCFSAEEALFLTASGKVSALLGLVSSSLPSSRLILRVTSALIPLLSEGTVPFVFSFSIIEFKGRF